MKRLMVAAPVFLLLFACTTPAPQTVQPPSPPPAVNREVAAAPTPKAQLQKPADVLADVLANYQETTTNCREYGSDKPRGHYYCSGVLVRTVNNGAFEPWKYSPTAVSIGATSYTWMRKDVAQTTLYHRAGFILRNRIDGIRRKLPALESGFICLYPYDAGTSTANGHQGCGYRGKGAKAAVNPPAPIAVNDDNSAYAWGSCAGLGITTASQWNNHFTSVGQNRGRQCSWSMDDQHGWNNMIASRAGLPNLQIVWNEILLKNKDDGGQMPKYIAAFFYDVSKAGGLGDAQEFQRKMNAVGYNVPILRLSFVNAAGNIFSYVAADQAVPQ